jgi:hypothetical protein
VSLMVLVAERPTSDCYEKAKGWWFSLTGGLNFAGDQSRGDLPYGLAGRTAKKVIDLLDMSIHEVITITIV